MHFMWAEIAEKDEEKFIIEAPTNLSIQQHNSGHVCIHLKLIKKEGENNLI